MRPNNDSEPAFDTDFQGGASGNQMRQVNAD
jgi:hypothetical protein